MRESRTQAPRNHGTKKGNQIKNPRNQGAKDPRTKEPRDQDTFLFYSLRATRVARDQNQVPTKSRSGESGVRKQHHKKRISNIPKVEWAPSLSARIDGMYICLITDSGRYVKAIKKCVRAG